MAPWATKRSRTHHLEGLPIRAAHTLDGTLWLNLEWAQVRTVYLTGIYGVPLNRVATKWSPVQNSGYTNPQRDTAFTNRCVTPIRPRGEQFQLKVWPPKKWDPVGSPITPIIVVGNPQFMPRRGDTLHFTTTGQDQVFTRGILA